MTLWDSENLLIVELLTWYQKKLFNRWIAQGKKRRKREAAGGNREDQLLAEKTSEEETKKLKDVGDSQWHADISTVFEVCSTLCELKIKNKFACIKFSVNFAQP